MSKHDELIAQMQGRIDDQAREIEWQTRKLAYYAENLEAAYEDRQQLRAELAALKAQPSGVVLPERMTWDGLRATACNIRGEGWNACIDEVDRLNSSPVSDGVALSGSRVGRVYIAGPMTGYENYNFAAFNAEAARLRDKGLHVENPADHGVVDGADWADYLRYDIGRLASCERIYLLPGWSKSKGARLEVHIAKALGMNAWYAEGAETADGDEWQARAALSAPSHGEQVRDGWQWVPVEPTPEMLAAGDKYIGTPATYKAMLSACPSPAITKDFSQFLSAVMDAAGLIRHGRQSKELSEYLGMKCMEYRGVAPSAGSQGGDV